MNSESKDELKTDNLVMFPSSKNYKVDLSSIDLGSNPLDELLNEFSHLEDDDLADYIFDDSDLEDQSSQDAYHSLDAFMTRELRGEIQGPDDKLVSLINDRIEAIKEAKARIKFYLEEIEIFLPSRKNLK